MRKYTSHLALSRGKGIRAAALIACAENDGGVTYDAVRLAASAELVHLATLVHDDVIDNADIRRGQATLQKKYGQRTAVICGDYLLCAALREAAAVTQREQFLQTHFISDLTRICLGELTQHINNGNLSLSVYRYLKIIAGKTAALFESAFTAGAMLLTQDKAELGRYRRLGRCIGMIFQLLDDCNDFEQAENAAKKPVRSDYGQGVVTLPLIAAMRASSDIGERLKKNELSGESLAYAVRSAGGLIFTRTLAEKYYRKAAQLIRGLNVSKQKADSLTGILDLAFFGSAQKG